MIQGQEMKDFVSVCILPRSSERPYHVVYAFVCMNDSLRPITLIDFQLLDLELVSVKSSIKVLIYYLEGKEKGVKNRLQNRSNLPVVPDVYTISASSLLLILSTGLSDFSDEVELEITFADSISGAFRYSL